MRLYEISKTYTQPLNEGFLEDVAGFSKEVVHMFKTEKLFAGLVIGILATAGVLGGAVYQHIKYQNYLENVDTAIVQMHEKNQDSPVYRNPTFQKDFAKYVELKKLAKETTTKTVVVYVDGKPQMQVRVVPKYPDKVKEFAKLVEFMVKEYHIPVEN